MSMSVLFVLLMVYFYCLGLTTRYMTIRTALALAFATGWTVSSAISWRRFTRGPAAVRVPLVLLGAGACTAGMMALAFWVTLVFAWHFPHFFR